MSQYRVPTFGDWNNPNAENNGYTTTFKVVHKDKRNGKLPMDHIPSPQKMDRTQHGPKRPSTSSGISDRVRNEKTVAGYDNDELWETQSTRSAPDNSVLQTTRNRRPAAYHQTERMRNYLSPAQHQQVLISRDHPRVRDELSPAQHQQVLTNGDRPGVRHEQSPAQYQQILTNGDRPRVRHERQRADASSGSTTALWNLPPEAGHHRRPSSSSDGSRRDMLSSREEENGTYNKPRDPRIWGAWNIDPNCTPEYTVKFDAVRNRKEKNVSELLNNPTLQIQSAPQIQPDPMEPQESKTNGAKVSVFRKVNSLSFVTGKN